MKQIFLRFVLAGLALTFSGVLFSAFAAKYDGADLAAQTGKTAYEQPMPAAVSCCVPDEKQVDDLTLTGIDPITTGSHS